MNNKEHADKIEFGRGLLPKEGSFAVLVLVPIVAGKPVPMNRSEECRRVESITCCCEVIEVGFGTPIENPRILVFKDGEWNLQQVMGDPTLQSIGWKPKIISFRYV